MGDALHYNFVFFFANNDYSEAILGKEVCENEQVRVYRSAVRGNRLIQALFKLHCSPKTNRYFSLPFKCVWFRRMYRQTFRNDLPICFVYMGPNYLRRDGGFVRYVKKQSAKNRVVVMHEDLISKKCKYDYRVIREKVDLATTYDAKEAATYGIHYFPETNYSMLLPADDSAFAQDVYFLGAAKDRHAQLLAIFKQLRTNGIRCRFLIAGVPKQEQVQADGLEYTTGISYEENLHNVNRSRCLLEVAQSGSSDCTMRAKEAIAYRRKLLTNCENCNRAFFNDGQLSVFTKPEDINLAFLKEPYSPEQFPARVDMNPMRRLYDMQEQLESLS